jgi:hypothetical protein
MVDMYEILKLDPFFGAWNLDFEILIRNINETFS